MSKTPHITLGTHYTQFIAEQVSIGRYDSISAAVHAGLRLLEERETKISALRQALIEGEQSGHASYSLTSLIAELDQEALH